MTLNLTIVSSWGIWQCTDSRLTRWPDVRRYEDSSIKHLHILCSDGSALITYSGWGKIRHQSVADWLRLQIRGRTLTLDETLILIREQATEKLGSISVKNRIHHTFNIGVILAGRPWGVVITNVQPTPPFDQNPPLPEFNTSAVMVEQESLVLVTGGGRNAITQQDWQLLNKISKHRPKRSADYRRVLADVNRRTSEQRSKAAKLVSKACMTSYMPPEGIPVESELHWWDSASSHADVVVPNILWGIDGTEMQQILVKNLDKNRAGMPETEERLNREIEEAGKRSVEPNN